MMVDNGATDDYIDPHLISRLQEFMSDFIPLLLKKITAMSGCRWLAGKPRLQYRLPSQGCLTLLCFS